jgi:very-short-patch-repair endonuclease
VTQNKRHYGASDDARLAELAVAQHGVVSRAQLLDLGHTRTGIQRRLEKRRLLRVHRGVYAVGHKRLAARGRWMAAVLASGTGAVLSHLEAAALHDLRPIGSGRVDVTATSRHSLPGIRSHWARTLDRDDCTKIDGIPVTTLARTYLDIAEVLNHRRLIEALEAGQRQNRFDVGAVEAVIARNPGRRGIAPLQAALAELADDPPFLQSDLERAFRALSRTHGLPEPQYNVYVEGLLVDAVWPEHRLVVEVDGWNYHRTKRSFEEDRRRDRKLLRARWRVARFTGDDVNGDPDGVAEELSELLRDGPWLPPARSGP